MPALPGAELGLIDSSTAQLLVVVLVATLACLLYAWRRRRVAPRAGPSALDKLKLEVKLTRYSIILPSEVLVEYGCYQYRRFLSVFGGVSVATKWIKLGEAREARVVPLAEVCRSPPTVVRGRGYLYVELPAVMIKQGEYSGLVLACFDTARINTRGVASLASQGLSIHAAISVSKGLVEARLDWLTPGQPARLERVKLVRLLLCAEKPLKHCTVLVEASGAGRVENTLKYPLATRLFLGSKEGLGFEELVELASEAQIPIAPRLKLKLVAERRVFGLLRVVESSEELVLQ